MLEAGTEHLATKTDLAEIKADLHALETRLTVVEVVRPKRGSEWTAWKGKSLASCLRFWARQS